MSDRGHSAVAAGRLMKVEGTEMLDGLKDRITNLVNSTGLGEPHFRRPGFGFRRFVGRPA